MQSVDPFFVFQFLLLLGQTQLNKLYLALFITLQPGLVRVVVLLHIFIADLDVLVEISRLKSNYADVKFVIAALEIFVELAFRNCNACGEEPLNLIHRKLITDHLLDVFFA